MVRPKTASSAESVFVPPTNGAKTSVDASIKHPTTAKSTVAGENPLQMFSNKKLYTFNFPSEDFDKDLENIQPFHTFKIDVIQTLLVLL